MTCARLFPGWGRTLLLCLFACVFGCRQVSDDDVRITGRASALVQSKSASHREEERIIAAAKAIVELEPMLARSLLEGLSSESPDTAELRARLALLLGDCEGALGILQASSLTGALATELRQVADGCARAMAGAEIVTDDERKVWIRLQNPRDRVLVPLIAEVASRVAQSLATELHVQLPRPIRIELVSDLTSLAHLTGLPLAAAENTGTVAIARWGRVTLLSPRSTREGYAWQDTLAHELAHLAISKATHDEAPLWLQEGLAKREESRWRPRMPFDDPAMAHELSRRAWLAQRSVGIEQLGASIALQPTAEAASLAYAEVQSFLLYWVKLNGEAALRLLLQELRGLGVARTDAALRAVSGYSFSQWVLRWQREFLALPSSIPLAEGATVEVEQNTAELVQGQRLGQLLLGLRHWETASEVFAALPSQDPRAPAVAFRHTLAELKLGRLQAAKEALGTAESMSHLDGAWLAVHGRLSSQLGEVALANESFQWSLYFAPTLERVACRGEAERDHPAPPLTPVLPTTEPWRSLCLDALGTETP